jgi:tRNA 2-selenouridine synthase
MATLSIPMATPEQTLAALDATVIDLRTPAEFAEDHLPSAVNVPLFDDVQRALIGTLYTKVSAQSAFERGQELVHERVDALIEGIARACDWRSPDGDKHAVVERLTRGGIVAMDAELAPRPIGELPRGAVVLHCWRGGLRSRSVIALVRSLGLERAVGLEGGYKRYRSHIVERLVSWRPPPMFALRGLTGVGKTLVLRELEKIRPRWTIDLEALAGHRSSILGAVGLEPCTQKTFETRLCARIDRGIGRFLVLEGESRKVGDVILPPRLWAALDGGTSLELVAPTARRAQVLIDDYLALASNRAELEPQLEFIEERLGADEWGGVLVRMLREHRERELVEILLERYYDPRYRHGELGRKYATTIDSTDPRAAAERVAAWVEQHCAFPADTARAAAS